MSRCERAPRRAALHRLSVAAGLLAGAGLGPLAGCTTPAPQPPPTVVDRAGPREWTGRFAVSVQESSTGEAPGRQESAAGRFLLTSTPSSEGTRLELELISPFGQVMATAHRQPDGRSTLILANGQRLQADSLDSVLERALGWTVPVDRFTDWLDDRFEEVTARSEQGGVISARDSGWRIERESRRWALERSRQTGLLRVILVLDR